METTQDRLKKAILAENKYLLQKATIDSDKYDNIFIKKIPKKIGKLYSLGIDEAGRGPLAGHLVYTLLFWEKDPEEKLYNDSKKVRVSKRNIQLEEICQSDEIGFIACCISPKYISINMLNSIKDTELQKEKNRKATSKLKDKPKDNKDKSKDKKKKICEMKIISPSPISSWKRFISMAVQNKQNKDKESCKKKVPYSSIHRKNLNDLSLDMVMYGLKKYIINKIPVEKIYMDCLGNEVTTRNLIINTMKKTGKIKSVVVEKKADSTYQIVSAASIVAKTIRDYLIFSPAVSKILYNIDEWPCQIGSGYPGDAITKNWVIKVFVPVFGVPSIVRSSWKPIMDLLNKNIPAKDPKKKSFIPGTLTMLIPQKNK